MNRTVIRLDAETHALFLARQVCDPITRQPFEAGDAVLACAYCKTVCAEETWDLQACCPQCKSTSLQATIPVTAQPPSIVSFTATPHVLTQMEPVWLRWQVIGDSVRVTVDDQSCQGNEYQVNPIGSRSYFLKAFNLYGRDEAQVEVHVEVVPPRIIYFNANIQVREDGSPVELSWQTEGANQVMIEAGVTVDVELQGTLPVDPKTRTTYTLTAVGNWNARSTAYVTVEITPHGPEITCFELQEQTIIAGLGTSLTWATHRAVDIRILPEVVAPVAVSGKVDIYPSADTDYVLYVQDYFGRTVSQVATVHVITISHPSLYLSKGVEMPDLNFAQHLHPVPHSQQLALEITSPHPRLTPLRSVSTPSVQPRS